MLKRQAQKSTSTMPLADAEKIVGPAMLTARRHITEPMSVAILGAGGHLMAFKREDGSGTTRAQIAIGRARGASGMEVSSRLLLDKLSAREGCIFALTSASEGRLV